MNWHTTKREQLARYTPKQIIKADHALSLGATSDFDGLLSPSMVEISSEALIESMDDQEVELLLNYLDNK